jgi:putative tricarboxylic transport membrane protein
VDFFQSVLMGFQVALQPGNLLFCFVGVLIGTLVGVLPGLGPVAAISLLLPTTFHITPVSAVIMLAGIYYGAMYGGSTTSILVNIPGEASSVVTCLDGYQMTQRGRAGAALFIAAFGSWVGGTLSVLGIMLLAPVLANLATKFGPSEIFALLLVAFLLLGALGTGSFLKTSAMIVLGMLAGTVGMDSLTGVYRFTHGIRDLYDGLGFVPVAMGMFGIGEILSATQESMVRQVYRPRLRELLTNREEFRASIGPILRGSGIGFFIGLLPGAAHILSSFVSYTVEKRIARRPEEFGHGRIEGVAGPETANNAATGGAMVPFLSLGIPTTPAIAVIMVALLIHGVRPGPLFISENPKLFWSLIASMYLGNLILVALNLPLIGLFVSLLRVPFRVLFPVILFVCLIGTYSIGYNTFDLVILLAFGFLGYFFRRLEFDLAPFVLALIIGPLMEEAFRQALMRSGGSISIFWQSPISLGFFLVAGALLTMNILRAAKPAGKGKA